MRLRGSLLARWAAIGAVGLFIIQLALVWHYRSNQNRGEEPGYRFPLPERAVAMALTVERAEDVERVLTALNSEELLVTISDDPISAFQAEEVRLPSVEAVFEDLNHRLGDRGFAAYIATPAGVEPLSLRAGDRSIFSRYPLRLAVELRTGRTLLIETRDDLMTKLYALPIGFFAGLVAVSGALIMLVVLRREATRLRNLADAMRRFGVSGAPQEVAAGGAYEFQELTRDFKEMQEQVHHLLSSRALMLGALGHDLRTYLARLRLKIDTLPEAQRSSLDRDIETMNEVLQNCLDLARPSLAGGPKDVVDLVSFLQQLVGQYEGVDFQLPPDKTPRIAFERTALRRSLTNLVDNALKFAGDCRIAVTAQDQMVEICVIDSGPGVPAAEIPNLFVPFSRADTARTLETAGSGLGLAITKALVEANDATIDLRTDSGGTRVSILVPLYDDSSV
ncbi:MAG: ATP-binding protein [Pseudomonadota bacterium]